MEKYRPSKEEYYLNIAKEVARRSTCMRAKFGAIIVRDDQIVATGYNGAPRKVRDCYEIGICLREKLNIPSGQRYEICRSVHSEQNAIINATRAGVSILGGDMYIFGFRIIDGKEIQIKAFPCFICKKMIINAGLKRVICSQEGKGYKVYLVSDWVREWRKRDMLEEAEQYGIDYSNKTLPKSLKSKQ